MELALFSHCSLLLTLRVEVLCLVFFGIVLVLSNFAILLPRKQELMALL